MFCNLLLHYGLYEAVEVSYYNRPQIAVQDFDKYDGTAQYTDNALHYFVYGYLSSRISRCLCRYGIQGSTGLPIDSTHIHEGCNTYFGL
jgi:hypothetical protein